MNFCFYANLREERANTSDEWEVFGRFEWANSGGLQYNNFSGVSGQKSKLALLTVGVNYFINSNVKFTADWGINFNNNLDGEWVNEAATGWRQTNSSSEWTLRAQIQLLF